jgi:hypothetical protein
MCPQHRDGDVSVGLQAAHEDVEFTMGVHSADRPAFERVAANSEHDAAHHGQREQLVLPGRSLVAVMLGSLLVVIAGARRMAAHRGER